jgi:hypothetical protein
MGVMETAERWLAFLATCIVAMVLFLSMAYVKAWAHDEDHNNDAWYSSLTQPDAPQTSCCGLADAYWCDTISVEKGKTFCTITDDRDDRPLKRPHVPIGTKIEIPNHKLKWEQDGKPIGNPTGHSVVFLSVMGHVFCFVQNTGI